MPGKPLLRGEGLQLRCIRLQMLQEFQVSRNVEFVPKEHVQKNSAINTTSWQFLDPGPVAFTACFIAALAALCCWKFGATKEARMCC